MMIALIGETVSKVNEIANLKISGRIELFVISRGGEGVLHSFGEGSSMSTIY